MITVCSKFSNLSNWKEEAWKNQGFNGIRTRDLRDTGAMLYQLSFEATLVRTELEPWTLNLKPLRACETRVTNEYFCFDHA